MVKNVEKRNCSRIFSNEVEFWPDLKTLLATLVFIFENFEIFKGQDQANPKNRKCECKMQNPH